MAGRVADAAGFCYGESRKETRKGQASRGARRSSRRNGGSAWARVVDRDRCCRISRVKAWPVLTPEQRFAGRGEVFAIDVPAEPTPWHTNDVLAMRCGIDSARRGFCFRKASLPHEPMLVLEFSLS
jgi:hypothetical protein